ncbi:metallophosphoesterase family protein [Hephaestia sp. GCM10023244]|uniref:metallophosphoesterase family protein n=1 Tax=unclassified Hephaestia TaxID=2631281 RepID=UPI0020776067|nr:metallophosphoesterase family protein [Hephaestia sp. MAHUQ-44]MCM8729940.1 serine/threonine protein phosphatase [Hephaestia sp. MAHUQ-44]
MLNLFRKRAAPAPPPPHAIPTGRRVYAVGDIHGRRDLLDDLIARIEADDAERRTARTDWVFLGDLVDRGPDSAGVIERVIRLSNEHPHVRMLLGNHEEVLLKVLDGDREALRLFTRIGGRETILSYGISEHDFDHLDSPALLARIRDAVPEHHVAFLRQAEDVIEIGDYAFVHAGVRPGIDLADQRPADLRWIRSSFLRHEGDFGKLIVHGHTITEAPEHLPNRIGIDTGAFSSGCLTALGLEGEARWFLATLPAAA